MKMTNPAAISPLNRGLLGIGLLGIACSPPGGETMPGGTGGASSGSGTGGVVGASGGSSVGGDNTGGGSSTSGVGGSAIGGGVAVGGNAAVGGRSGGTGGDNAGNGGGNGGSGGSRIGVGGEVQSGGASGTGGSLGAGGSLGTGGNGTGGSTQQQPDPSLVTSGVGQYWQVGEVTEGGTNPTVTVVASQELQEWDGFGGTFNEAGWDALKAVSDTDRELAIRLLFHETEGAGFTYGRIPIGSSDYALGRYSLNETTDDYQMNDFSIERDREDLIPYIQAAQAVKPDIRFWASPWSPPIWMKDNNAFDGGNIENDPNVLEAHALYLARFVEAYAEEGIEIEAIHPQNEPGYQQDYPSCGWSASVMTDYIGSYLGPLFADRLPDTEIWLGTMSNTQSNSIVTSVMGNSTARSYVSGIGLQWGMGDSLAATYAENYDVPIMQTEHEAGNNPWEGHDQSQAPNDHDYAEYSWQLFTKWIRNNVNSYLAWNMILDTEGRSLDVQRPWAQNALLAVDRGSGTLNITPTYYVFRHFSRFVEPGAVRVATQNGDALAFKNPDGSIVTVLYNSGQQATNTTLEVAGTMLQFSIPARGWATVNWEG